ncbi:MAG: cytochrome c biogenesis protein CcsA [Thermoplasmatota archaeon]
MSHELNSLMILIHPPLAILGYLFTFLALKKAVQLYPRKGNDNGDRIREKEVKEKDLRISLTIAWWLTFLGLVTGMIWAQLAWGSFWSWDPKETATLFVFLTLTAAFLLNMRKVNIKLVVLALVVNVLTVIATVSVSFVDIGLHSFG